MSIFTSLFSAGIGKRSNANSLSQDPIPSPQEDTIAFSLRYERGGTIVVFMAKDDGNALRELTLDLLRPLREHCRNVVIIDAQYEDPLKQLASAVEQGVWFALSFFGWGQNIDVFNGSETVNLWAAAGVPFVRIFGDIPAYLPDTHAQVYPNSINFYGHPEHSDFYRRWFDARGISLTMHPILYDILAERPSDLSRKIVGKTIVFPKNGNCPEKLVGYWRSSLPPMIAKALESLATEIGSSFMIDKPVNIAEALVKYFSDIGIDFGHQKRLIFFMTAQLDDYLRRIKSTMIAKALLDFPIVVRGRNWGHVDFHGKRARLDPDIDYDRTRQIYDDALAIIDMSPNTQDFHDRVQRAAGRYTAFLTNRHQYFIEQFENFRSFTFEFNPDSIRDRVDHALSNPEETVEMGLTQAERIRELTGDERYAESLLNAIDACALTNGQRPEGTQIFVAYPPQQI